MYLRFYRSFSSSCLLSALFDYWCQSYPLNFYNQDQMWQLWLYSCTHALLPSIIIPYRILSNPSIIRIIKSYRNITDSCTVISKITGFSRETVNKIIRFYIRFHQERLNSFLSVFTVADFYDFDFILNYFYEYHAMFMQRISVNNMTIYP